MAQPVDEIPRDDGSQAVRACDKDASGAGGSSFVHSAPDHLLAALLTAGANDADDDDKRMSKLIKAYCMQRGHGAADKRKSAVAGAKLLRHAVEVGNAAIVRLLVPQHEDAAAGNAPLLVAACAFGRLDIAKYLVEHGAQLTGVYASGTHMSPLYAACARGDLDVVKWLVADHKAVVDEPDSFGKTPLIVAIENGSLRVFQYLLFMGADATKATSRGVDAYTLCAQVGNFGMVRHFLELAMTVFVHGGSPVRMLEGAVRGEHAEIVDYILQHSGGKISSSDVSDNLCAAVQSEDSDVAEVLLHHGANVNWANTHMDTPLYCAIKYGNLKMVELLLKRGANVTDPASQEGESALYEMAKHGRVDMIKLVHTLKGDEVDFGARSASTKHAPLHGAAANGHAQVIRFLLDELPVQIYVDIRSTEQDTPLLLAAHKGYLDVVDLLVSHGADIDKRRSDRSTPLIEATESGHFDIVQYLCEHGADANLMRDGDLTALCVAARHNFPCIAEYLVKGGIATFDPFAFHVAVVEGNTDVVRVLLSHYDNIDARADLLCQAALRGYFELVKLLIDHGCDVNARYDVITGEYSITVTPLTAAALSGDVAIVRHLCENGADVDGVTDEGETALFLAAGKGRSEVAAYLVKERRANFERATVYNFTPVDIANCMAEDEVLYFLLESGANAPERHNLDYFSYVVLSREDVSGLTHEQQQDIEVWDRFFAFDMFLKGEYEM